MKLSELVEKYVGLRDQKAEMEAAHKEALKPLNDKLDLIENKMLEVMEKNGLDSIKTSAGTAYKSLRTSATVADKDVFWTFVVSNQEYGLLDKRVLKSGVEQYIERTGSVPAGVNWRQEATVNFRRASADIQ